MVELIICGVIAALMLGVPFFIWLSIKFDDSKKYNELLNKMQSFGWNTFDDAFSELKRLNNDKDELLKKIQELVDCLDLSKKATQSAETRIHSLQKEIFALQVDVARYAFEHDCISKERDASDDCVLVDSDTSEESEEEIYWRKKHDEVLEYSKELEEHLRKKTLECDIETEKREGCEEKYSAIIQKKDQLLKSKENSYIVLQTAFFRLSEENDKNRKDAEQYHNEVIGLESVKVEYENRIEALEKELKDKAEFFCSITSGTQRELYPVAAGMIADLETLFLGTRIKSLDWGNDWKRAKKVESIRELRVWAKEEIEKHKIASYQLQYLLALYPGLQDVLDVDYADLQVEKGKIPEHDYTRDYLSKEEWDSLTVSERNQLALDRYVDSHSKTKWQIGRDYEMYIGYKYETDGWSVQYTGVELGYEDLGRDLIAVRGDETQIVQCKYWSETKVIHEKHIMQLYGTMIAYRVQNPSLDLEKIKGVFVTNIVLSDTAAQFAKLLGIVVREKVPKGEFPRIKCNIGKDEFGSETHIYHLPMDLNYDSVKLDKPGECMVFTVKEAEEKGFRRAFKWSGAE